MGTRDRTGDPGCPWGPRAPGGRGLGSQIMSRSRDGKGPETPLQLFERFLHEGGLTSKVWRVRELVSPALSFLLGSAFVWRSRDGRSRGVFGGG